MYVVLSLVVILCSILFWYVKKQLYYKKCLSKFPGPPNVFFFGCALDFFGDKGMLTVFNEYTEKYGDICYGRIGPNIHTLFFSNVQLAKTLFTSNTNLTKGNAYDLIQSWLGEGLLTTPEEKWKAQRKMMAPAFNSQVLNQFITTFDIQSNILLEKLKRLAPIDSIDIHPLINLLSLDIICETSMGVSMNAQQNQNMDYVQSVKEMCSIIVIRSFSAWKSLNLPYKLFSEEYQKEKKCLKILHGFTDKVIAERKKQRQEEKKMDDNEEGKRRFALLDILLDYSENEQLLSEEELRQEVHTFMFAGHDTVTSAMSFTLYEIAHRPEIQETLFEEQKSIFGGDFDRPITPADIHDMRYLDLVMKESMRLNPPVPAYTRYVTKEFNFEGNVIPVGTMLIHFAYGLHRSKESYKNPEEFDPSRFEIPNAHSPYAFLPFSTGPRNCIGQKFAIYEMKVVLSKLIRNFEFAPAEPEHKMDIRAEVVLISRTGIKVKIIPRKS